MKDIFVRNAYPIFELSKRANVDVGIAMEYFSNNCFTYPTILHPELKFDYEQLSAEWIGMDYVAHAEAKTYWSEFMKEKYHELGNAFADRNKEKFEEIVQQFLAKEEM